MIPVAAATMTPFPLLAVLCLLKLRECYERRYAAVSGNEQEANDTTDDSEKMIGGKQANKPIYCPVMDLGRGGGGGQSDRLIRAAIAVAEKGGDDVEEAGSADNNGKMHQSDTSTTLV